MCTILVKISCFKSWHLNINDRYLRTKFRGFYFLMKKINEMEWNDTKVRKKRLANRSKRILNWNHADKNEKILITSSKDFFKNERKSLPNE